MNKKLARVRRAARTRLKIKDLRMFRLVVNKTAKHMYAQVINVEGNKVISAASTLNKDVMSNLASNYGGNKVAAARVGTVIAERAIAAGIERVAFDRSGYKYHGRIKLLAEAAREAGLKF